MSGPLLAVLAVGLVLGTALTIATTLRLPDLATVAVATWVIGFAEVIGLLLFLSLFEAVTRPAIFAGLVVLLAAAAGAWHASGRPRPPALPEGGLRALRRVPVLLALVVVTGLALLYSLAIVVGTPPASHDALTYHLTRAAFWSQDDRVGYIADAFDERLNAHPPNAEIALTFLLEVGRHERLAGFVQFGAALAIAVGVFLLARRIGLPRREAGFGALLFLTLPVVLLQTSTAQNDLVAASFLVAAAVFVTGSSRTELGLAALAAALAVGTKVPATLGLPVLAAVAFTAMPKQLRIERFLALAAGAVVGSYWYLVNIVETGHLVGDLEDRRAELSALFDPSENFYGGLARTLDWLDLSGAVGVDALVYAVVAAVVTISMLLIGVRNREQRAAALVTGGLIAAPLLLLPVDEVLWSGFSEIGGLSALDDRPLPPREPPRTIASDTISWFGPLGFALSTALVAAAIVLVRRRSLRPMALVLAVAPFAWLVFLALSLAYDHTQGRFFMFPLALSAALWGVVLRDGRIAVAVVVVAATTAALSLTNFYEKPSGLRLLEPSRRSTVWGAERWAVQSNAGNRNTDALRFLDRLPDNASVALGLGYNDFGFPAFGPQLERQVELVPRGSGARASDAEWALANPERASEFDRSCWDVVLRTEQGWAGFRRFEACAR